MSAPDSGSPEIRTGWAGGRPPLDPELGAVLASLPPGSLAGVDLEGIAALRETLAARVVARERIEAFGVHIEDVGLTSFDGAQIALSTITPTGVRAAAPCLYFIHGGGMIAGTRMLRADALAETAVEFGLIVVTVEYRLAPEWPYPAAVEDCYAGLEWIVKHASPLGIDPEVLIVQGASAGGGLAAGVALMSRDRNGPRISNLILQAPMLDDRNTSTSSRELHADAPWDRQSNLTGKQWWAADTELRRAGSRKGSVGNAPDLHRRRSGRDLSRRGDRVRGALVGLGYASRIPPVARRLARVRLHGPARRGVAARERRATRLPASRDHRCVLLMAVSSRDPPCG